MEANAALQLYINLYNASNKNIVLKAVVVDDDSSIRSLLTQKANNPKGGLSEEIPQPEWLFDLSHPQQPTVWPRHIYYKLTN